MPIFEPQILIFPEPEAVALEAARQGAALNQVSGVQWLLAEDPAEAPGE